MPAVKLGDVAIEARESCKGDKTGYFIVGLEHITPEEVTLSNWSNDTGNSFTKMFRKNDILFGRRRAYLKKAAIAPFDGICSGDITVIRAKSDKLLPELLPFVIQNDDFFDYAVEKSAGSLSPRVKWEHLKNYEFKLPSLEKQKGLAKLLWSINDSRKAYQALLRETDELVKSQFIEMFGDTEKDKIGNLCVVKARIGWQGLKQAEFMTTGEYYLVTGIDFVDHRIDFAHCKFVTQERYDQDINIQLRNNDVLITKDGTIGKVAIVEGMPGPATLNSGVFVVRCNEQISQWFLYYVLQSYDFENFIESCKTGATISHLNQKSFINFEIPVPTMEEQNRFVEFAKQTDKSKFELKQAIESVDNLIRSLVQQELK